MTAGAPSRAASAARRGRDLALRATGAGVRGAARIARRVRGMTRADGAGESGLSRLIGLHGVQSAGDALVAVALAGTLFFGVPVGEARGRVALYLLITMAPFAVVAPVVGPVLDRFRHGRRYALATTLLGRAVLAWLMARAVLTEDAFTLYPAAFGVLVLSKAYGVSRSAVVPRVLPASVTLVRANARLALASLALASLAAPVGVGIAALLDAAWTLRAAAVVFLAGSVLALRLPGHVDSAVGEHAAHVARGGTGVGRRVPLGLRSAAALRAFAGFLTLFLAFLLRTEPLGGLHENVALGLLAAAAAGGGLVGTTVGARLKARPPEQLVVAVLALAVLASAAGAWWYALGTALAVAAVAGAAQSLGKLALDAMIQRDVADEVRTSAFARTETALQLAWVVGGGLGIALPLHGRLGLGLCAAGLLAVLVVTLRGLRRLRLLDAHAAAARAAR